VEEKDNDLFEEQVKKSLLEYFPHEEAIQIEEEWLVKNKN
jgi:hypothetical protein